MAILRAGPWGNLNNSHEDEPAIIDENTDIYPVNCALGDWPNQTWSCVAVASDGYYLDYTFSRVGLGEEVSKSSDPLLYRVQPTVTFNFCYQANDEFNINFNWSFTGGSSENLRDWFWSYSTIDGDQDSYYDGSPADSGTEIIVLPKATLGIVTAYVQGYDYSLDPLTVTASLS